MVVVGGGYIAVEFAGIFNGLGVQTHLLYRGEQILRGFDADVRRFASEQIARHGVDIRTQTEVKRIENRPMAPCCAICKDGSTLACDAVMFATGRKAQTANLGLEDIGVKLDDKGTVMVDFFQTAVPSVYARGCHRYT